MRKRSVLGILLLALLLVIVAAGAIRAEDVPVLLADVNRTPEVPLNGTGVPVDFFQLGDQLLFSTVSYYNGSEDEGILWITDGTAEGTRMVSSSLCPVLCHAIKPLAVWHGLGLVQTFSGETYESTGRLWLTDGTTAGTVPLTGVLTDVGTVVTSPESGVFYFSGCRRREPRNCVLWRSDGTRA